jgi:hypothetical protein
LSTYKDEKRGATLILLQSNIDEAELKQNAPSLDEFPLIKLNVAEKYWILGFFKIIFKILIEPITNMGFVCT